MVGVKPLWRISIEIQPEKAKKVPTIVRAKVLPLVTHRGHEAAQGKVPAFPAHNACALPDGQSGTGFEA